MTDVYFVGNISKRLVCLKQLGATALCAVKDSHRIHNLSTEYFSYKRAGTDMGKKNSGLSKRTQFHPFSYKKSLICLEGISVTPFGGRHNCLLFIPAAPLSRTLEGFLKLTQHPSRAIDVAGYVAVGIAETQGHCQVCHARRGKLRQ